MASVFCGKVKLLIFSLKVCYGINVSTILRSHGWVEWLQLILYRAIAYLISPLLSACEVGVCVCGNIEEKMYEKWKREDTS